MRQLKNNLDELYDMLVSVQVRESLKRHQLDVETVLFEQQAEELKDPNFAHPRIQSLYSNEILEQSALRRKSSKQYEDVIVKKVRPMPSEFVRILKPAKPEKQILKNSKIEIGPELAMTVCFLLTQGIGLQVELPLKRTISMREEEHEDTLESIASDEIEEPRILARRRYVRGLKAASIERYFPGTFRNEVSENMDPTFSEEEEIDDRYCKALGSAFKIFVKERRVTVH